MQKTGLLLTVAVVIAVGTSCIVSDQMNTLTIHPDGSADWSKFRSNIRSTEEGEKGAAELQRFVAEFEARRDSECVRIREAGGEILAACWVQRQEPYATFVTAKLPGVESLQAFLTRKNDAGEAIVHARFVKDGQRRRLTLKIRVPKEHLDAVTRKPTRDERRQDKADSISNTRIAVTKGRITSARGFAVAGDKRSALVDLSSIRELVREGEGQTQLFLEWKLADI